MGRVTGRKGKMGLDPAVEDRGAAERKQGRGHERAVPDRVDGFAADSDPFGERRLGEPCGPAAVA